MGLSATLSTTKLKQQKQLIARNRNSAKSRRRHNSTLLKYKRNSYSARKHAHNGRGRRYLTAYSRPNAAVADTMAPALTEPLSPTEKLTSSTATATPTTRSSSRKVDTLASTSTSSTSSSASSPTVSNTTSTSREKKSRSAASHPTTSTRVTRSKDAYQRVFEQALIQPAAAATTTDTSPSAVANLKGGASTKKANNELMGLSAALSSNNNNSKCDENSPDLSNTISPSCKDNSTEQLLADLTNDFEEAITAEICLRKQLEDVNLGKSDAHAESEPKDILVIKVASETGVSLALGAAAAASAASDKPTQEQHMESPETTDESIPTSSQSQSIAKELATKREQTEEQEQLQKPELEQSKTVETQIEKTLNSAATARDVLEVFAEGHELLARPQLLAVEELPPISTDSTMTASEVEDNLEERLSQLDGTAIVPAASEIVSVVDALCAVPATPPRTPTQQQQHQQQVLQLQQQLQQTPPTQLGQQHALTPQSATSSVNTLGSGNLPQAFMKESTGVGGGGGELEDQDIEEVLKALKGFDTSSGGDTLPDFNVLFNEVYTTLNYEELSSQPASITASKPSPIMEMLADIEKKQLSMQRKMDFLLRRMRKLQARNMCKHTSEEVAGLIELAARMGSKGSALTHTTQEEGTTSGLAMSHASMSLRATRPLELSWSEEHRNPVSAAQVCSMLRKLETAANVQQLCTSASSSSHNTSIGAHGQVRKSKKAAQDALVALPANMHEPTAVTVVPTFQTSVAEELTHVEGLLQTEMREVQNAIDSDATESSSGGESADEMVTYNNQLQQSLSIAKRAAWRYSRDRAAVASRWSWLLSQIADLEIKIRQHSELQQEIVRTKGAVTCGSVATDSALSSAVNGYKGEAATVKNDAADAGELAGACRTREFVATQFRKRKLLQTTNIHTISKKAARPSTVKCGCQWPLHPCALCTGRTDPTAPRDLPDTMMMPDRIALLDPGYHPVLSFPEDVCNSLHFEAIARLPDWQQRVMRCQVKSIAKGVWKAEREAAAAAGHHLTTKRRYIKKKDRVLGEKLASTTEVTATAVPATPTAANTTNDAGAGSASSAGGNGTGTLSTTSTTPLVANKLPKNARKLHCHLVGDGVLLEPMSPAANTTTTTHSSLSNNSSYIHQTGDYPLPQNCDPYNPNQAHSSSISNNHSSSSKNNKHRKLSSASATTASSYHQQQSNSNHYYNNSSYYHHNNNQHHHNSNGGHDTSFLYTHDNWDSFAGRSRTSSPTHGGSNYHKYERSLDRKNRSSYDIDNIVIPYSVAAATRVEILNYKEIPTPKWRLIEEELANQLNLKSCNGVAALTDDELSEVDNCIKSNGLVATLGGEGEDTNGPLPITTTEKSTAQEIDKANEEEEEADIKAVSQKCVKTQNSKADEQESNAAAPVTAPTDASASVSVAPLIAAPSTAEKNTVIEAVKNAVAAVSEAKRTASIAGSNATEPAVKKLKIENIASFRVIDNSSTSNSKLNSSADLDFEMEEAVGEDITDDAMMLRHERALTEERRKFSTYLKFPWSTRSRANRRIDSRAESSGANTPDPSSPAPNTPSVGGGDQESIPSPLAPSTPLNPLDGGVADAVESAAAIAPPPSVSSNFPSKRYERRRTTSAKKEPERRSSTPDLKELMPPYEPLRFPLPDELFESLQRSMSSESQDNSKFPFEDCQNLGIKYPRGGKNSYRSESSAAGSIRRASKSTANCDANVNSGRKQKALIAIASQSSSKAVERAAGGRGTKAIYENGKAEEDSDATTDAILDEDEELEEEEEDDEDYPRHHLAPPPDEDESDVYMQPVHIDDAYDAYVGGVRSVLGESDGEYSDLDPFQDDDPNDPEWKGESAERTERLRRKL